MANIFAQLDKIHDARKRNKRTEANVKSKLKAAKGRKAAAGIGRGIEDPNLNAVRRKHK